MIQIITATAEHADLIADISRETFYESFAAQNTQADMDKFMNEQFTKEKLMAEVGAAGNHFLLAYHNSNLAGYVKLKEGSEAGLNSANAIETSRIYARKDFIGKGIGKALMEASLARAKAMRKEWIWLGVWEQNHRAIQFYTSFGFEKFSEHDFLLGTDLQRDWLMRLRLC